MKKISISLLAIILGLVFSISIVSGEMAKEGSGEIRGAKSGTFEILKLGEDRIQMNYDEQGAFVVAPENSPFTNASFQSIGSLHAIKGEFTAHGGLLITCTNGDQVFGVYESQGVLGQREGVTAGGIELVGGTGECSGITGKIELLPRPTVRSSKKGTYQQVTVGKVSWKIP